MVERENSKTTLLLLLLFSTIKIIDTFAYHACEHLIIHAPLSLHQSSTVFMIRIAVACFIPQPQVDLPQHGNSTEYSEKNSEKRYYIAVPDVEHKLPGRGSYVLPSREVLKTALQSK